MCQSVCNTSKKLKETLDLLKKRNKVIKYTQVALVLATASNVLFAIALLVSVSE